MQRAALVLALAGLLAPAAALVVPRQTTPGAARHATRRAGAGSASCAAEGGKDAALSADAASRRDAVQRTAAAAAAATVAGGVPQPSEARSTRGPKAWEKIELGTEELIYDMVFDDADPKHGWIVGSRGTFYETFDAGKKWSPRSFAGLDPEEEITYRFQSATLKNGEGWVIGKPPILLHTTDAGRSFERIPLSSKLPGEPLLITSLGQGKAEMTTSSGAVYKTDNAGRNWKAQVKETIDATLNRVSSSGVQGASYFTGNVVSVTRDSTGAYLAVSSRGNFYLTWQPGEEYWAPHNRGTSRRIQNMGFVKDSADKGLWMTLNGGILQSTSAGTDISTDPQPFESASINTGGYGLLDVAWRSDDEVWAVGGSNTLFLSKNGGKTWEYNGSAAQRETVGNLYRVRFFGPDKGFAFGSEGLLMRYVGLSTDA